MANRTKIEKLEELIKDSIGGELVDQTVTSLLPPGENYGSVMYKVDFKVKKDGKEEEYHAVAKCTPLNTVTQELFNIQETFKAEIAWYTTVIPTLKQFQKDHGVEKEIDFFQQFYGARISLDPKSDKVDLDGVILTQNLKYLGYDNKDRLVGFDLPTTYSILRDLATFHAVPLAIKIKNPVLFKEKIKPYLPKFGEMSEEMTQGFLNNTYSVLEQIPECKPLMDRIRRNMDSALGFKPHPLREPWITVIHMDLWINNVMVTAGRDPKTIILDLQTPGLGNLATDLIFFLLTSVKFDIIQDKFDDFVQYYFGQFSNNLRKLNIFTDDYTFEGFIEEIETEVKVGELSHVLQHIVITTGEKGKSGFDASDDNFFEAPIKANELQIERFKWIISEAIRRNWI